jgi:predicted Zn finger-like uncharacterized protein
MILSCPNCGTQYVVKDDAIPPEGRQVRCAACKHSWHQDPEAAAAEPQPEAVTEQGDAVSETAPDVEAPAENNEFRDEGTPEEDEGLAEATLIEPRSGPEAEERAYEEAVMEGETVAPDANEPAGVEIPAAAQERADTDSSPAAEDWREPPQAEATPDVFSPFAAADEEQPKKRSALTTILIIALVIVVLAVLFWLFAPVGLKARLGLAAAGNSPLALVTTHMDRQRLESGNELLTVTGRVVNPTPKEQDVPPLRAQLKDRAGKVVKTWTIPPPARSLAAGASATFNSAEMDVPQNADQLTITLTEPAA